MSEITTYLALVGTAASVFLYISPFPSIQQAWQKHQTDQISHSYLLMSAIGTLCWILLAIKLNSTAIIVPNSFGFTLSYIYLTVYHSIKQDQFKFQLKFLLAITICAISATLFIPLVYVGVLGALINFFGYLAPLEQLIPAIKEKDSRYIDVIVTSMFFISANIWTAFGILSGNIYLTIPNAMGIMTAICNFITYFWAQQYIPHSVLGKIQALMIARDYEKIPLKD